MERKTRTKLGCRGKKEREKRTREALKKKTYEEERKDQQLKWDFQTFPKGRVRKRESGID